MKISKNCGTRASIKVSEMKLSFEQGRVLGVMIEKAMTTPANYPMSLNAVVVACNQVSNREPIVEFTEDEVELILRGLADDGLAKMVHRPGDRVVKYRQALDEQLELDARQAALVAVLMLRGPQTPGELRQRTGRYVEFTSLPELEEALVDLGARQLARRLERRPGQKESRYQELLTGGAADVAEELMELPAREMTQSDSPPLAAPSSPAAPSAEPPRGAAVAGLAAEVDDLKRRFEELLDRLGETIE
jgi:uncharacterized protein YceH (UPF0502 family)